MTVTYIDDTDRWNVSVTFDRYDGDRCQYRWTVGADGETIATGDDLRSGSSADVDEAEMLGTLLNFLSACAESLDYRDRGGDGENVDLFPVAAHELIQAVGSDGFAMAAVMFIED